MITIVPTMPNHLDELRDNLREDDLCEVMRLGIPVRKALWRSYRAAVAAKTALVDGKVAAIWGCGGTMLGQTGRPWLLTAHASERVSPLAFARVYRKEVQSMLQHFPILESYVDTTYIKAVRLLEIVGFTLEEPQPLGKQKAMFRKFRMERGE